MKALHLPPLSADALSELDRLYRTTRDVRLHTRAHSVLLATEQHLGVREIATIVRHDEDTVRLWLTRYLAEGSTGLHDAPRPGAPANVTLA